MRLSTVRSTMFWVGAFTPIAILFLTLHVTTALGFIISEGNTLYTVCLVLILLSGEHKLSVLFFMLAALSSIQATVLPQWLWGSELENGFVCLLLAGFHASAEFWRRAAGPRGGFDDSRLPPYLTR